MNLITKDRRTQLCLIAVIYAISLAFWLGTIAYRSHVDRDIESLKTPLFTFRCDGWCVLHFVSYALMGFLAPDYWYALILIGFLFEFVEMGASRLFRFVDYSIISDTLVNASGVVLGVFFRSLITSKQ